MTKNYHRPNKKNNFKSRSALETFVIQYKEPEIKENKSFKLAFGRDMILQVYMDIEWNDIIDRRNRLAINTNAKINEKRIPHKYKVGDKIFIILKDISEYGAKLNKRKEGPYKIVKVYKNGTVRIQRGSYRETLSIDRIKPFFERTVTETV